MSVLSQSVSVAKHFWGKKTETKWMQYSFSVSWTSFFRKHIEKSGKIWAYANELLTSSNTTELIPHFTICFVKFREISRKRRKPVFIILSIVVVFFVPDAQVRINIGFVLFGISALDSMNEHKDAVHNFRDEKVLRIQHNSLLLIYSIAHFESLLKRIS